MKSNVITILIIVFLCLAGKQAFNQQAGKETVRLPAVAGSFYPSHPQELRQMIGGFLGEATKMDDLHPFALIVPHAGYVFSGKVAAAGYRQLDPGKNYRHIFIIGPNHRVYFEGINIFTGSGFQTPLGTVPVDPLALTLAAENRFISTDPLVHKQEHCIEVQLPFLQVWLKKPFSIVPVLLGGESQETARQLAKILEKYFIEDNLFIISADFSHYPEYHAAIKADKLTADALASNSPSNFLRTIDKNAIDFGPGLATSICGWMPALSLLRMTEKKPGIEFTQIMYSNSGDSPYGDRKQVVGYWAIAATEKKPETGFQLPEKGKTDLLKLVRSTIIHYLRTGQIEDPDLSLFTGNLKSNSGAFVTLMKKGELRGCIGMFISDQPLYRTVQEMAIAAATRDTRFLPVTPPEMDQIELEISVLTPLKRIYSISEFRLGRDGIYMKKGSRSGTYLPQVAEQTGWSAEEFMGHCARDKAFIGWDGWKDKDTELYTYQALVFSEHELMPEHSLKDK